jgi:hypothetical protein
MGLRGRSLDSVDKIIWVLPVLAVLDVVSTFYVDSLGYSIAYYEQGFFASFFVQAGLIFAYVYAVVYVLIIFGISYVLWYIKNKKLKSTDAFDKAIFLVLVGVTCFIYVRLTVAFITNFFLPNILERGIDLFWLDMVVSLASLFTLVYYMWYDVVGWVRSNGARKQQ